jgi:hypothetical protein
MYNGSRSIIHIDSPIPNAKVSVNNKFVGTTPLAMKVNKSLFKNKVLLQSPGYNDTTFVLKRKFDPVSLIGTCNIWVDVLTGAVLDYSDSYYYVKLESTNKSDSINIINRSQFYVVKNAGDTIFTEPSHEFEYSTYRKYISRIKYTSIEGRKEAIGANYVKKTKSLKVKNSYVWAFLFTTRINTSISYVTYLNVLYYQNDNYNYGVLVEEMLENGKYHIVKSNFDYNSVRDDGLFNGTRFPTYYLYEDGKILNPLSNENLLNILRLRFSNEKEMIQALEGKCTFKNLEKYLTAKTKINKV